MFDTHCHLNFKAFKKTLPEVIENAYNTGVKTIVIPGTDVKTSKKAIEIASQYVNIYAAVGIHPHHVYKLLKSEELSVSSELSEIEKLLTNEKVVAVGEVGMDRHVYEETVYGNYAVDDKFISLQKELLSQQIQYAVHHKLSLILHNREAISDIIDILTSEWNPTLEGRTVFHCCEPEDILLHFAKKHSMYIGIDGDLTFIPEKQDFIKKVPLEMLVLETDSPFLLPEPLRTQKKYPNEPKNVAFVAEKVAELKGISIGEVIDKTTQNAKTLFGLSST